MTSIALSKIDICARAERISFIALTIAILSGLLDRVVIFGAIMSVNFFVNSGSAAAGAGAGAGAGKGLGIPGPGMIISFS